jgi:hypothetical protein
VHPVGEDREEALHDPPPLLGVPPLGEVHRALDVGEQHRHLLALTVCLDPGVRHGPREVTPGRAFAFIVAMQP